jgi:hypothetical protein
MKSYLEKGQMDSVAGIIALIAGVGVAVLALIFMGVFGGQLYDLQEEDINLIAANEVDNESWTVDINQTHNLGHKFIQDDSMTVYNNSNGVVLGLTNFTIDYDAGTILGFVVSSGVVNNTAVLVTYTWGAKEIRESIQHGVISSFEALETSGDYLPIVVLAVVIAFVLAIVLGFTAMRGGSRGGAL